MGGDGELLSEIVGLFLADCPRLLGEIRGALSRGEVSEAGRVAHSLKGAAQSLSAGDAALAARQLEAVARAGDAAGATGAFTELERKVERLVETLGREVSTCAS